MKRLLLITVLALLLIPGSHAAPKISLLTCYPGSEVYELEGHTALRIIDDFGGDTAFNWGTFDFDAPNFLYRFVKGETDYMLSAVPTDYFLRSYEMTGRKVVEQELNLTDVQAERLAALVGENMRPENRVYRYNYVLDNCATRPLALIEQATGAPIAVPPYEGPGSTFREAMRHYHGNYPWYQFGIDLALGSGIDARISDRQKSFAPVALMEMMRRIRIDDGTGRPVPAIVAERTLVSGIPGGAPAGPTSWWLTPLFWCWMVFAAAAALTWRDLRRHSLSRWFDTLLFGAAGIAGLLLTFLIFVSVHEATSPNWLYLWLNPMGLFVAAGIWIKSWQRAVYWWQIVNFALSITLAVLGVTGVQHLNCAFWPLIFSDLMRTILYIHLNRCRATGLSHKVCQSASRP